MPFLYIQTTRKSCRTPLTSLQLSALVAEIVRVIMASTNTPNSSLGQGNTRGRRVGVLLNLPDIPECVWMGANCVCTKRLSQRPVAWRTGASVSRQVGSPVFGNHDMIAH